MKTTQIPGDTKGATQVHVWTQWNLPHSKEQREYMKRAAKGEPPPIQWCGGKVVDFDGTKILMMPWINPENEADSIELLKTAEADVCMGHFDLNGFSMNDAMTQTHGHDKSIVSRFEKTYSSHFHHKNDDGQVYYLGNLLSIATHFVRIYYFFGLFPALAMVRPAGPPSQTLGS